MQRIVRPARIAGLLAAVGLVAAGCAGSPAPRPGDDDARVFEAVEVPRQRGAGGDDRRPPVPPRRERTSPPQRDPEPPRDDPAAGPRRGPGPARVGRTMPAGEPTARPVADRSRPAARPPAPAAGGPAARPGDRPWPPTTTTTTPPPTTTPRPRPPAEPDCPEPDVVAEQADRVHAAVTASTAPGFAGLALAAADCRIDLWWAGEVPSTVAAAIEPIDGEDGVGVVVHDAAHSAAELAPPADALIAEHLVTLPGPEPVAVAIEAVTPRPDGAGIAVEISIEDRPASPTLAEQVAALLTERAGVPVFVEVIAGAPTGLGRSDEPSPGPHPGERSYHPVPGRPGELTACTTGFGLRARDGEERWLLTADHCTGGADGEALDGDHAPLGAVTEHRPDLDSARIALADADADADGGDPGPLVANVGANYRGKRVCHAGVTSGEVCDLVIRDVDRRQWSEELETYVSDVVRAEQADGARAARPGDSGGPVYRPPADGGEVQAQGILVMGHTRELLDSPVDTVYYVDIRALLAAWGAEISALT